MILRPTLAPVRPLALGIASNSTPAAGIYTAIVAGFLISALGGSKVQIGGPTAAFIPVVVSVSVAYGPANLVICTMLAGLMLIGMGAARMGTMIKFIPFPVTSLTVRASGRQLLR